MADWKNSRQNRVGSISINVEELVDEGEENPLVLQEYWKEIVVPLSTLPDSSHGSDDGDDDERPRLRRRSSHSKSLSASYQRLHSHETDEEAPAPAAFETRARR